MQTGGAIPDQHAAFDAAASRCSSTMAVAFLIMFNWWPCHVSVCPVQSQCQCPKQPAEADCCRLLYSVVMCSCVVGNGLVTGVAAFLSRCSFFLLSTVVPLMTQQLHGVWIWWVCCLTLSKGRLVCGGLERQAIALAFSCCLAEVPPQQKGVHQYAFMGQTDTQQHACVG